MGGAAFVDHGVDGGLGGDLLQYLLQAPFAVRDLGGLGIKEIELGLEKTDHDVSGPVEAGIEVEGTNDGFEGVGQV